MEENNVNDTVVTNDEGNYEGNTSETTNPGSNSTDNNYSTNKSYTTTSYATETNGMGNNYSSGVPAKVSIWSKIKQFLCQEIVVELTPRQERAFKEVYDFWHQDAEVAGTKEFWLQNIEITL